LAWEVAISEEPVRGGAEGQCSSSSSSSSNSNSSNDFRVIISSNWVRIRGSRCRCQCSHSINCPSSTVLSNRRLTSFIRIQTREPKSGVDTSSRYRRRTATGWVRRRLQPRRGERRRKWLLGRAGWLCVQGKEGVLRKGSGSGRKSGWDKWEIRRRKRHCREEDRCSIWVNAWRRTKAWGNGIWRRRIWRRICWVWTKGRRRRARQEKGSVYRTNLFTFDISLGGVGGSREQPTLFSELRGVPWVLGSYMFSGAGAF